VEREKGGGEKRKGGTRRKEGKEGRKDTRSFSSNSSGSANMPSAGLERGEKRGKGGK